MLERLLGPLTRRFRWAATALRVQQRFSQIRGGYLASAVTLNLFLSLFPLLLVAIAVVGFITDRSTEIPGQVIANLGISGHAADEVATILNNAAQTKEKAGIVGLVLLLWSGLGVVSAIEYALDSTWQVTGRGIKDKARGVLWGAGALVLLAMSSALTTVANFFTNGLLLDILSAAVALVVDTAFWMWTFVVLSYNKLPWKAYAAGAILGGVGLEIVKQVIALLPGLFNRSSALYGSLGVVFAIFAVLALFGRLLVYASVLNVVRWEGHYGTVTLDIEVPKVPGSVPLETDRAGAVEQPVTGDQ